MTAQEKADKVNDLQHKLVDLAAKVELIGAQVRKTKDDASKQVAALRVEAGKIHAEIAATKDELSKLVATETEEPPAEPKE